MVDFFNLVTMCSTLHIPLNDRQGVTMSYVVWLGFNKVSAPLDSYVSAVNWARDFADGIGNKDLSAPLSIRQDDAVPRGWVNRNGNFIAIEEK